MCLGPVPIKFVLLGDPAMRRPGFNDHGATAPHRRWTRVSPSMNYLCTIIYLVLCYLGGEVVNHRINTKIIREYSFW